MAGKSTFLRQIALISLLSQMGSFVPAEDAEIGLVDKVFCRVGAQDNLARGESTFLVEMNETANILRNATEKSLLIMDEVGRGTSTGDGFSIAQGVSEYIQDKVKAKTLFATHFHELTDLKHSSIVNLSLAVIEEKGTVHFLKQVVPGPANNSYGIHVAKIAGLPKEVTDRAEEILSGLTELKSPPLGRESKKNIPIQRELFTSLELIEKEIRNYPVNSTTPLEALNKISEWKDRLKKELKS